MLDIEYMNKLSDERILYSSERFALLSTALRLYNILIP